MTRSPQSPCWTTVELTGQLHAFVGSAVCGAWAAAAADARQTVGFKWFESQCSKIRFLYVFVTCIYDGGSSSFPSTSSGNLLTHKLWGKLDHNLKHHLNILRQRICRWIYVHISNILYSVVISTLFKERVKNEFYPFIWSISLPSSVFLNMWYLGLFLQSAGIIIPNIWKNKKCSKAPTSICLFGLRFPALAWTALDPQNLFPSTNRRLQFAGVPCIRSCHSPASHTTRGLGMNYSLHTVQEECSHLVVECSGRFNAQGLKSWKPSETSDQQDGYLAFRDYLWVKWLEYSRSHQIG